ncbi:MAG: hypothetical protein WAK93_08580 [Solirubrobacteraceae bacterium]
MEELATRSKALVICLLAACALALSAGVTGARASAADPYCTGEYGGAAPRVGAPLRFGIDPGIAGSTGGVQLPSAPDSTAQDVAMSSALRPPGKVLVVRLNRLFWSGGDALIAQFQALVSAYSRAGLDVELQVRYHPGSGEDGDLAAWEAYVRHVVDVFGPDPNVVAMTITNEVNVTFSSNTSDGAYTDARDALIDGIEAAHNEAVRRGFDQLKFGFTYAYRFSPADDASFFSYLAAHGGAPFQSALGFVGLDFYPGSVYPPAMAPGDTYRAEMAQALGTLRDCFMPMAGLGFGIPIWITENGVPTGGSITEAQQASDLVQLVDAAQAYSGTFNVTDYRWFNLRDSNSSPAGSLPGAATTFATDGLLRDDYSPKPSFAAYRAAIAALGQSVTPSRPGGCRSSSLRLALARQLRPIRRAAVYIGRRRLALARGRHLRSIRLAHPPTRATFTLAFRLRLRGGRIVRYRHRFEHRGCRIVTVSQRRRAKPRRQKGPRGS